MKKLLYIGNKLSKHGNNLTSIETLGKLLESEKYLVYYSSSKKNKFFRLIDMIIKTIYYHKKVNYVLIDTYSTQNFWYSLIISQICRISKTKYFCLLRGGDLPSRLNKNPFLSKLIFKNSHYNVAPSSYLLTEFKAKGYENVKYIPNTIEINNYPFLERKEIEIPKLLWVRSLASIYNPLMAIKVLAALKKHFPKAELCMVGPDKESILPDCKKIAKELNVEVTFTGKLEKKEWILLSEKFNIFINTTHFDNTPISVIEAMALGLPVVTTNVGGIPYLLENGKHAILVNDNDFLEMSLKIKELVFNSALRNQLTSNARELVQTFDWEQVRGNWFEILK